MKGNKKTYCDVASNKLWNLIICWVNDDVEGDVGRVVFAIGHGNHELVSCGLHPLVSGLHIVHMAVSDVFV